jgi:1-aminocyclopropane-1-carboxylate deaminase/D-cysteine desulfhydrase-like pyridoxal-dependent ACC family enzyme
VPDPVIVASALWLIIADTHAIQVTGSVPHSVQDAAANPVQDPGSVTHAKSLAHTFEDAVQVSAAVSVVVTSATIGLVVTIALLGVAVICSIGVVVSSAVGSAVSELRAEQRLIDSDAHHGHERHL